MSRGTTTWVLRVALVMGIGALAKDAAANQTFLPVSVCQPDPDTPNAANVWFSTLGSAFVNQVGVPPAWGTVLCAFSQAQSIDQNDDIRVYFDDTNGNVHPDPQLNMQNDFACNAFEVDEDLSTVVFVQRKLGCATPGGCQDGQTVNGYAGANFITFTDIQQGGPFSAVIDCQIPAKPAFGQVAPRLKSFFLVKQ
jgi:hypothetical protein